MEVFYSKPKDKELMEYIEEIKTEADMNVLQTLFTEAIGLYRSEKQVAWLTKEKDMAKARINNTKTIN